MADVFFASKGFILEDWAGNRLFPDKKFDTFEEASGFADQKFPKEEDRGEVYVTNVLEKEKIVAALAKV